MLGSRWKSVSPYFLCRSAVSAASPAAIALPFSSSSLGNPVPEKRSYTLASPASRRWCSSASVDSTLSASNLSTSLRLRVTGDSRIPTSQSSWLTRRMGCLTSCSETLPSSR